MNLLLLGILWYAAMADLSVNRIPNFAVSTLLFVGVLQQLPIWLLNSPSLIQALTGLALGLAMSLPFYMLGVLGAGDAKLLAVCGWVLGPIAFVWVQLFSLVCIGLFACLQLIYQGQFLGQLRWWYVCGFTHYERDSTGALKSQRLPMGGAIFLAVLSQQLYF